MYQLEVNLNNNSYPILIDQGIDKMLNNLLDRSNYSNIFIITQQSILDNIKNNFLSNYPTIIVDENEASKSVTTAEFLVQELLKEGCDRESLLIGFGGGTITDLTGFVASIFMRGIDHVFIPTTLLGMVDASIGGKTGVNSNQARNVIGTFKHPKGIYIDPLFLNTLPKKDIIDGFAEVIKYGLIVDMELYNMVEYNFKELIQLKDLNQIKTWTRCGMGPCQGRTCQYAIASVVSNQLNCKIEDLGYLTGRSPLRPVPLDKSIGDFKYEEITKVEEAPL